jgi:thiol-disulfide isomerase/thioredoxin
MMRTLLALTLALAALTTSPWVQAQNHQLAAWPAHRPAPALVGTDLQGKVWHLVDLRGKAVLINFWASWCAPCQAEMPSLQALAQAYGPEKLVVLAVNFKESGAVVQRFVQRNHFDLPVLLDPTGAMARQWGAHVFPTTVLVAANGQVRAVIQGEVDWSSQQAATLIEPLLAPVAK